MYSVVLLMALSGSADTPSLGWGCKGCCGGDCNGCCGYSCSGCCGGSCHGCCGGGHKMFGGHKHGCCGGCCGGYSCDGCCGGCHGGHHKRFGHKHGCCGGCNGCCGGGCCGGCGGCCGGTIVTTPHASVDMPKADTVVTEGSAPATIVVNLPATAKLTIDGNATTSTSERRVFVSPALEAGQEYYYTLKAEINGQVKEERVSVKAGQEVAVKIEIPEASVASK